MKKLALTLATAGTLAAVAVGTAGPALAAPRDAGPTYDAVYVTDGNTPSYQAVDCHVHVIWQGNPVDVAWC
jgi:hypothetical protein